MTHTGDMEDSMANERLYLDASTTVVGFALETADGDLIVSGAYKLQGHDWVQRVMDLESWLATKTNVEFIGYEIATGNRGNMATNRKLGAVEYVIRVFCERNGIACMGVTASQVKATGVNKDRLQLAELVKGAPLNDAYPGDEADALGIREACRGQR